MNLKLKETWYSLNKPVRNWLTALIIFSYSFYLLDITEALYRTAGINLYYILRTLMQVTVFITAIVYIKNDKK